MTLKFLNGKTMFEYANYYDFFKTENGEEIHKPNTHAIHFGRFNAYNRSWSIPQILIYEYILFCYKSFGNNFTQSNTRIQRSTRLSKNSVLRYLAVLEEKGYIEVQRSSEKRKGKDWRNRYTVNFQNIIDSFDEIYDFNGQEPGTIEGNKETLAAWYEFLRDQPYNRNK